MEDVGLGRGAGDSRRLGGEHRVGRGRKGAEAARRDGGLERVCVLPAQRLGHCPVDPLGHTRLRGELDLKLAELSDLGVGQLEGLDQILLRDLVAAGLDHRDRLGRAADDEVERGLLQVGEGRIDRERTVDAADADRAHRAEERHRREHERRRRAVDGQDVVRVHLVGRERGHDDLDLVLVALRPERPDRPVDHPRGQDRLLAGATLALEEAAGDLAGRVHLLLDVDGEREEVRPLASFGAADGGRENDSALLPDQYCTVGLLGDGSGLERDLLVADRGGEAGGLGLYCNAHFPVSLPRPAYRRRPSSLMSAR